MNYPARPRFIFNTVVEASIPVASFIGAGRNYQRQLFGLAPYPTLPRHLPRHLPT